MDKELGEQEEDIWIKIFTSAPSYKKYRDWVSLFIDRNTAVYFDSFGIEHIREKLLNKVRDKSITHNIFRIEDNESIMCGFYCIAFIEYVLAGKTLFDYTNLFSPNDYKKNCKIIYNYFKNKYLRPRV